MRSVRSCQVVDFHGAPLSRTWVKLGAAVKIGDDAVALAEAITGWRVGDRVIVTATTRQSKVQKTFRPSLRDGGAQTEGKLPGAATDAGGREAATFRTIPLPHAAADGFGGGLFL